MKTGFTLIRKEADSYRSQGLHEEALELYATFIVRSAKIDPATKYFIKKQVQLIEEEMTRSDSGATQELASDRGDLNKKGGRKRTMESHFFPCAQGRSQPPSRNQKDEADIAGADWLDPLADIYALVSTDKGCSLAENLNGKALFDDREYSKVSPAQDSPIRKRFHSDYTVKSFIKCITAFILVGSVFLYFVGWFSEVKRDRSGETVQEAPTIVLKKVPAIVSKEHKFALPNNGMEDPSAKLAEEEAVFGDAQPVVDPAEPQEVDKTPSDDFQKDIAGYSEMPPIENTDIETPPKEPDPASVIDYVLKKRGL